MTLWLFRDATHPHHQIGEPVGGVDRARGLGGGGHGNQLVTVRIVMPADLRPEERELYEKLKALRGESPRSGYAQG